MKCSCHNCRGSGQVECCECGGSGEGEESILTVKLDDDSPVYHELIELREDAKRICKQARTLQGLRPERREIYERQSIAVLREIEAQATKISHTKIP